MDRRSFLALTALLAPATALAAPATALAAPATALGARGTVPDVSYTGLVYKGFGTGARTETAVRQMLALNLDWFYTWGESVNMGQPVNDFTPMIWGESSATPAVIAEIEANLWKTGATRLLTFNEPDHEGQADMSVDRALALWPVLQGTSLKLGSPATRSPNSWWLNTFMARAAAQGYRVDFVTAHIYQNPDAKNFFRKVDTLYERWGKPIWITETAVADWDATASSRSRYGRTQINEYMSEIYAGCVQRSYVERFAWKTRESLDPQMGTSALFHTDGALTSTGQLYASL